MRLRVVAVAAGLLLASVAAPQPPPFQGSRLQPVPPVRKVAQLGACTSLRMVGVSDGVDATDCAVGGGTTDVVCYCKDGTWGADGVGGGGSGTVTGPVSSSTGAAARFTDTTGEAIGNSTVYVANGDITGGADYAGAASITLGAPGAGGVAAAPCLVRFPSQFVSSSSAISVESCTSPGSFGAATGEILAIHFADEGAQPPSFSLTSDGLAGSTAGLVLAGEVNSFSHAPTRGVCWSNSDAIPALANPGVAVDVCLARNAAGELAVYGGTNDITVLRDLKVRTLTAGTLATSPGVNLSIAATAPAATTGASQAGKIVSVTASNAVASTDTAGAAAGGAVTITGGNAARNSSGSAAGGSVNLVGGAGIGGGADGQVLIPFGTVGSPGLAFGSAPTRGIYGASGATQFSVAGVSVLQVADSNVTVRTGHILGWSAGSPDTNGPDAGFDKPAPKIIRVNDGTMGAKGWLQWAGECFVAADATNATATLATTGCSIAVISGRKYAFKCEFFVSDSVAAEGAKIDFAGGTAAETDFRAQVTAFDTALNFSTQSDDLTDVATASTFTGNGAFEVHGSFEPSSSGTFIPRFAQASHAAGTLTLYRGSHCLMWDAP